MATTLPQEIWSERVVAYWADVGVTADQHGNLHEVALRAWEEFGFMEPELYAQAKSQTWATHEESAAPRTAR